jgi:sulfur carrier protein ThiS
MSEGCASAAPVDRLLGVIDHAQVTTPEPPDTAVTVQVRLGARLGPGVRTVRLQSGATVADLLAALAPDLGIEPERLAGVAVAVQGEIVGRGRRLHDGEALALVLPVAGGS